MKILHVLISPRAEGTPRLVLDWLLVDGYEQELLFLSDQGELRKEFEQKNNWQYYNDGFQLSFKNFYQIIKLVKKVCEERKPDIVISWPTGFSQWIHLGARSAGVKKMIVHAGNPPGNGFVSKYLYTYLSFWMGALLGSKVIACSKYVGEAFNDIPLVPGKNIFAVYNGVNVGKFLSNEGNVRHKNFMMVATLEKHKDHSTLLHAWKLVEDTKIETKLLIVGDGSLRDKLKELATRLGLDNVVFMGSRDNVPQLLKENVFFVLSTTEQEGFGTVLIEALASGCRVIASDVTACREVLQNGKYGVLVKPHNPTELAQQMIHLYRENKSFNETEQRNYALTFSIENMIANYVSILNG